MLVEISDYVVVVSRTDQILELLENIVASTRVKGLLSALKSLYLEKEIDEVGEARDSVDVDVEQSF